jgi:ATP-dependent RNA circularization protein (DNA/RNA ligase family)
MQRYPKMKNLFKRNQKTGKLYQQFADPAFKYLRDIEWIGTEKIDGTNVRICWDGKNSFIRGKEEHSELPAFLYERLITIKDNIDFPALFQDRPGILFGEGFGHRINEGYSDLGKSTDFILFDVLVENRFMPFSMVQNIAVDLRLRCVPVVFMGTLTEAVLFALKGFQSNFRKENAEGLVIKPSAELLKVDGSRVIAKLKTPDLNKNLWEDYNGL